MSERLRQIDQSTRERRVAYRNANIEPRWRPRYRINEQETAYATISDRRTGPCGTGGGC